MKLCKSLSEVMDISNASGYDVNKAYEASWGEEYMYVRDKKFRKVYFKNRIVYLLIG